MRGRWVRGAAATWPRASRAATAAIWTRRWVLIAAVTAAGCRDTRAPSAPDDTDPPNGPAPGDSAPALALTPVVQGLASPVFLTAPPGDDRLFVVEQPGRVRIVRGGVLLPTPFLDITDRVVAGGERGLLGLAFHPDYAANGRFYVSYTGAGTVSRVERYAVSADPDRADPASASLVFSLQQPASNHNGGQVSFGPDGFLYIALGDGGGANDPQGHGQNTGTLFGTLLRVDVDGAAPYVIPPGNPFANGVGGRAEIWAYGLRNPWRFAHDPEDGLLYIADVGQQLWEEVNVTSAGAAGLNYGWNIMEGDACFQASSCDDTGLTRPALVYHHNTGAFTGCSVTGGYVYRGSAIPTLRGWYLYGDYCRGWVRGFRFRDGAARDDRQFIPAGNRPVASFGVDGAGELYVVVHDGRILRVTAQ